MESPILVEPGTTLEYKWVQLCPLHRTALHCTALLLSVQPGPRQLPGCVALAAAAVPPEQQPPSFDGVARGRATELRLCAARRYVLFRDGEEEPVWQGGKNAVVHGGLAAAVVVTVVFCACVRWPRVAGNCLHARHTTWAAKR